MRPEKQLEKAALTITRWVGSPVSIVIHTILFIASFAAVDFGIFSIDRMLLVLTTIVSLEAIYLAIFIQMTINYTTQAVEEVAEDVEEMQEDIGEIQEDVGELQEDVEDISEDFEEIAGEEAGEEAAEEQRKVEQKKTLVQIQTDLKKLMDDISRLQQRP